jgi:AcrR family transcriptional regulator
MPRSSREVAAATRQNIVETAVGIASTDGLEGLTFGRLADDIGMSKSGLVGHFSSKEGLQLAVLEEAIARFRAEVWGTASGEAPGLPRLRAATEAWISYLEREIFPGGCFLSAATMELDDRPGPCRDVLMNSMERWLEVLTADAREAQRAGDLPEDPAAEQLVFEIHGLILSANWSHQLVHDANAFERARAAVARLLDVRK